VGALALHSIVARTMAIVVCAAALGIGGASAQQPAPQPPAQAPDQPATQSSQEQPAAKIAAEVCLGCHGVAGFSAPGANGQTRSLYVDPGKFRNSVHGKRACVDCHQQITQVPHRKLDRIKVGCVTCHEDLYEDALSENNPEQTALMGMVVRRIDSFMRTVHAKPNQEDQSRTNAACYNCHDAHYVYPPGSPIWSQWRFSLPSRCGKCHTQELAEYATSVHGRQALLDRNPKAAICADCHTSHNIASTALPSTLLVITQNCGNCHEANLKSYLETYHGQVEKLGYAYTAKCFNCHGYHNIQRVNDPGSKVSPANRLQTCRQCHVDATAGFVTFEPHATTHDFARYPYTWLASKFMALLLGGTLSFFWLHSALWWLREYRDHRAKRMTTLVRAEGLIDPAKVQYYERWPAMWRIAHLAFALTVIVLVFTGMTLFYADSDWAPMVQKVFGGPRITGTVHRIFAVAFVSIFFAHLAYVALRIGRNWRNFQWFGSYSFIPNLKDLSDAIGMFKWFFGLGAKPLFDKWTYWEKFDYWAPFWGVTIIGVSGAVMWFKTLTASVLPGWVFNVAMIFHGEEAFLAAGFLFTVHFFNNHWRPENFPLDILMFTGSMPLEKFRREHSIEYDRLVRSGQLDQYLVEAPSRPMKLGSQILGFALMAAGLILLILILSGFVRSMLG
jgi:cytochrome b subunit of formate dehydrogenase